MGYSSVFKDMIEEELMSVHTAYLAKVLSVSENTAKIQPLGLTKAFGAEAKKQSPIDDVPIARHAMLKSPDEPIAADDIVVVICCERSIEEAKNGENVLPVIGHHSMSDSIIVGIL